MSWISNAWDAAKNWVGDRWDEYTGKAQTEQVNQMNIQTANTAYNRDLEMWNRQNEYNSPTAQMKRFNDAGLNPNLIYGSGTASAGNASSLVKYNAPQMQRAPAIDYVGMTAQLMNLFQDFRIKNAQADNIIAAKNRTNAEAQKITTLLDPTLENMMNKNYLQGMHMPNRSFFDSKGNLTMMPEGILWKYDSDLRNEVLDSWRKKIANLKSSTSLNTQLWDLNEILNPGKRTQQAADTEIKEFVNKNKVLSLIMKALGIAIK